MRTKNYIKVLPVVLLLTGCGEGGSNSNNDVGKEITRKEFEDIALSLKNNYQDYSSIKETFKTEKVEASEGNAKNYLNLMLSLIESTGVNKEYKEGYELSHDIAPSSLYTTLSFYQETSYVRFSAKYYSNNDKLTCKYVAETGDSNAKVKQEMDFYFNTDGLEELFNLSVTQTFPDNSTLSTTFKTSYTWNK